MSEAAVLTERDFCDCCGELRDVFQVWGVTVGSAMIACTPCIRGPIAVEFPGARVYERRGDGLAGVGGSRWLG